MTLPSLPLSAALAVALAASGAGAAAEEAGTIRFNRDIRPIMSDTCFHCHGPDKNSRKGDLRLDVREDALKPAKSGAIPIVPGDPGKSEIIKRIFTADADDLMPPDEAHKTLTAAQKDLFRRWVAEGAVYEAHWAYTPLVRPEVPTPKATDAVKNAIDAFILAKQEEKALPHSAEAPRARLLRRLSLDLTGLPPTTAEVAAFLADTAPDAFERQVDRLLASPRFGERMAVWWLDAARFTDTVGFHGDQNQRIFPYRDWVIGAFNRNLPFDQFTTDQLAGDLLPHPTLDQLVATGFNRLNMMTREGGAQPKEYLAKYGAERVRTVGSAFLGSTFACAECHDHKFDPIPMRDFYALQAFFADVKQWGVYMDYGYTPNPELRGFSNDHPFPPEIAVESPYLKQREDRLRAERRRGLAAAVAPGAAFDAWREESRAFFGQHADGWATPAPVVASSAPKKKRARTAARKQPAATAPAVAGAPPAPDAAPAPAEEADAFQVQPDGSVLFDRGGPDTTTVTVPLPAGWLSSFRVELLPHAAHNGRILRSGKDGATTVKVAATLKKAGAAKEQPLRVHHAGADLAEPRFANGAEIIGIQDGWKTVASRSTTAHAGEWLLTTPLQAAAGDSLVLRLEGNMAGCLRVSVSPFAADRVPGAAWRTALARALRHGGDDALVREAFATGTTHAPAARERANQLFARILECRGGQAWTMVTQAADPLTVRVLPRGNWMDETGEVVLPATPSFVPGAASTPDKRLTRLDLARWLCSQENPLTPRTVMNRLWKQFFGNALSAAVDDLGAQGEPPTHPELLDWLAAEFRDGGWDVKRMIRLMVTSATYRQASSLRPEAREADPANRLLTSQNARRLDAEFVRDNALFIAGALNLDGIGGPSVKPYQPAGYYVNLQFPNRDYTADPDDQQWRRGVYMHWQRTFLHPMLANFDAPMRDECAAARTVSNTPQQALTLLNDPTFVEAARVLAARLLGAPGTDAARLDRLWQLALARPPKPAEAESMTRFLATQREGWKQTPEDAAKLLKTGLAPVPAGLDTTELAAWTSVCRVVLNLQETITRY